MLFNSFTFLALFIVLVIVYYVIPSRFRWPILLLASLYYYYTFSAVTYTLKLGANEIPVPVYLVLLLGAALVAYLAGVGIVTTQGETKRLILALGVLISLAPLAIFKYFDFFAGSYNAFIKGSQKGAGDVFATLGWVLPVGLSFFTFSCVSYLVEVYKKKVPAERNFFKLALYVAFFPKLLAGPIDKAANFLPQIVSNIRFTPENITAGVQLVLWGLFKKVAIADRLAVFVNAAYSPTQGVIPQPIDYVIATYFYAFQIYCDFSGYSDIAIGLARILGFNLMENFRRPYLSTSVIEFWGRNRWHISLNNWFREYMFFPMGGSRVPQIDKFFNLLTVFVVSGLWHGANWTFIIWGALNGIYQVITLILEGLWTWLGNLVRLPQALVSVFHGIFNFGPVRFVTATISCLITFHLILLAWVFFRANSFADAQTVLTKVWSALPNLATTLPTLSVRSNYDEIALSVALIVALMVIELIQEHQALWQGLINRPIVVPAVRVVRWAFFYALFIGLIAFGKWGATQFVYMSF